MNLPVNKWIIASVRKHCLSKTEGLPLYFEEMTKQDNTDAQYLELRIDGPYHRPQFGDDRSCIIEVNILCVWKYDERNANGLMELTDVATWMLNNNICVYKLGTKTGDDRSYFETLRLIPEDFIKVSNFGQIGENKKIYQATVEAHYELRY